MFNLGFGELLVIGIVAILVFGKNLPRVASEAMIAIQKLRRSVNDLRRETGIDQEIRELRHKVEQEIIQPVQKANVVRSVQAEFQGVSREVRQLDTPPTTQAPGKDAEPKDTLPSTATSPSASLPAPARETPTA